MSYDPRTNDPSQKPDPRGRTDAGRANPSTPAPNPTTNPSTIPTRPGTNPQPANTAPAKGSPGGPARQPVDANAGESLRKKDLSPANPDAECDDDASCSSPSPGRNQFGGSPIAPRTNPATAGGNKADDSCGSQQGQGRPGEGVQSDRSGKTHEGKKGTSGETGESDDGLGEEEN